LSSSSRILSSSSGNELCGIVVQEVFVDIQVFLFSENCIVGFEPILGEERIVALSLDIYEWSLVQGRDRGD
jgi:hypothetical protein